MEAFGKVSEVPDELAEEDSQLEIQLNLLPLRVAFLGLQCITITLWPCPLWNGVEAHQKHLLRRSRLFLW